MSGAQTVTHTRPAHLPGFDYLRAFFCVGIVALHSVAFGEIRPFVRDQYYLEWPKINEIVVLNIIMLGVPVFMIMSLVLYIRKRMQNRDYLQKRIRRLTLLYLFWVCTGILTAYIGAILLNVPKPDYFSSVKNIIETIVSGGKNVYYYLFSLAIWTVVLDVLTGNKKLLLQSSSSRTALFILGLILFCIYPYILSFLGILVQFWTPLNFAPYCFGEMLIWDGADSPCQTRLWIFGTLFILFSILEWKYFPYYCWNNYTGLILPEYTRISVVFGSLFVVLASMNIRFPPPIIIKYLAAYSLGIYCLHSLFHGHWLIKKFVSPDYSIFVWVPLRVLIALGIAVIIKRTPVINKMV
jgi:hypothetical protein